MNPFSYGFGRDTLATDRHTTAVSQLYMYFLSVLNRLQPSLSSVRGTSERRRNEKRYTEKYYSLFTKDTLQGDSDLFFTSL